MPTIFTSGWNWREVTCKSQLCSLISADWSSPRPWISLPHGLHLCQNQGPLLVSITWGCRSICGQPEPAVVFSPTSHLLYVTWDRGPEWNMRQEQLAHCCASFLMCFRSSSKETHWEAQLLAASEGRLADLASPGGLIRGAITWLSSPLPFFKCHLSGWAKSSISFVMLISARKSREGSSHKTKSPFSSDLPTLK